MFSEMRAPWLVKTSSSYFHKARALRHTSSVLRYNARKPMSPVQARAIHGTLYERNRNTCSSSIVEFYKHLGIFRNTREVPEALAFGSYFSALLYCSFKIHAYGYGIANEYIDYIENKSKIMRKSIYHRKHYIQNAIFDIRKTNTIYKYQRIMKIRYYRFFQRSRVCYLRLMVIANWISILSLF